MEAPLQSMDVHAPERRPMHRVKLLESNEERKKKQWWLRDPKSSKSTTQTSFKLWSTIQATEKGFSVNTVTPSLNYGSLQVVMEAFWLSVSSVFTTLLENVPALPVTD
ncbi:hypothetical protein JOB18_048079 [Solea senegalensis]|uniref:Uncharacterized protein n=1 Tax=Solea senegalensis TaxID=28829 RepID=A0AAV6QCL8_SOLSE|nr:hypothetical protein JOB18_048079 [Solea senegalensis]